MSELTADRVAELHRALLDLRKAQTRLTRVEAALRRLTKGDYGWCVECEEEIGIDRLRAQPEAPFCLSCQASREGKGS
ncbi:MAG: TraR/DksA C4-type zinc finger protein [Desulfuromonadales bacterium]